MLRYSYNILIYSSFNSIKMAEIPQNTRRTWTLQQIADEIGVSKDTVRKKISIIEDLLEKNKRKRYYKNSEAQLVFKLFE